MPSIPATDSWPKITNLRAPCKRDARRFRAVITGDAAIASVPEAKGTLTVHGEGRADPAQTNVDLEADVGSGVVVVIDGKKTRASFGHPVDLLAATPHVAQPLERTRLGVAFSQSEGKPFEVTAASLSVPGALQASCSSTCPITVKVTKLEPKRGGVLELTADGSLGGFRVHAQVTSFVRDVVTITP